MRFLFLVEDYLQVYSRMLQSRPDLSDASFAEQSRALYKNYFYHSDSYAHAMRELGHKACQVVMDVETMQRQWAREHNLCVPGNWIKRRPWRWWWFRVLRENPNHYWRKKILLAQIEKYQPDVLYAFSGLPLDTGLLHEARARVKLLVCQWSAHINWDFPFKSFDLIVSASPKHIEEFRAHGLMCEYLNLAFDQRILDDVPQGDNRKGVIFVGNISGKHTRRLRLLEYLCANIEIDIYGFLREVPEDSIIRSCYKGEAIGKEMYQLYSQAKIVIHNHIDDSGDFAGAKRLFEATGMGALLLTDMKKNLNELFIIGEEIMVYTDEVDCLKKIKVLLCNDNKRRAMAMAGQKRTLQKYSYEVMAQKLVQILGKYI